MVSATEDASPTGWGGGEIVCDAAASGIRVITEILEGRTGVDRSDFCYSVDLSLRVRSVNNPCGFCG